MKTDLIKDIESRTAKRKKAKQDFDKAVNLSAKPSDNEKKVIKLSASDVGKTVRLLDEGVVVDSEGNPLFLIKKGAIEQYYNSLPEDYVGSINIGHQDFASFPFLVGNWSKKDLTVVDIGNDRKGLDVKLNVDKDSIFIKELSKQDYPIAVSAEFFYTTDYENSELLNLEVVESINIKDFAIVGEPGNVNSSNIKLSLGGKEMSEKAKKKEGLFAQLAAKYLKANEPEQTVDEEVFDEEFAAKVVERLETLETENTQMLEVMEKMDAENEELKTKLAAAEEENKKNAAVTTNTFSRFKELTAKYVDKETATNKEIDEKNKNLSVLDQLGIPKEKSDDGMGEL